MSIFKCDRTNSVIRVKGECATREVIHIDSFASSTAMRAIPITGYTLELSTNHQFLHSLDEFIYAFAFGDRIGELTVTGIAFTTEACEQAAGAASRPITDEVKQENVYKYYLANKFSKTLRPSKIKIGENGDNELLLGFLTGVRMEVPNPALPIMQWALRFNVIIGTPTPTVNTSGGLEFSLI